MKILIIITLAVLALSEAGRKIKIFESNLNDIDDEDYEDDEGNREDVDTNYMDYFDRQSALQQIIKPRPVRKGKRNSRKPAENVIAQLKSLVTYLENVQDDVKVKAKVIISRNPQNSASPLNIQKNGADNKRNEPVVVLDEYDKSYDEEM